ncbi:hypothetical protein [Halomontanus rarus]|uniref:hypothetical protein n=1 Tax=Halomontanus rarus TaxID=3034020 RepID=UPI0023E8B3DB|nr:hypothetical protein [Halovivax sp. TS33]
MQRRHTEANVDLLFESNPVVVSKRRFVLDTVHPFPTFSEAFKHACQAFRRDTSTMSCCVE